MIASMFPDAKNKKLELELEPAQEVEPQLD
jgi:hypothetical protein